jgi:hypothetical protein
VHRSEFQPLDLIEFIQIGRPCQSVQLLDLVAVFLQSALPQLETDEFTYHADFPDIVTRITFYRHHLPDVYIEVVDIPEILLSATLKTHFDDIERLLTCRQIHICQPIVDIQFIATACTAGSIAAASGWSSGTGGS